MELDKNGIASDDTKEAKKQRKQFIIDFYGKWITANPENAFTIGNIIAELPRPNVKNQSRFSKLFIMKYEKSDFGKIKLTVGELRGSGQKIQYCITAIENG